MRFKIYFGFFLCVLGVFVVSFFIRAIGSNNVNSHRNAELSGELQAAFVPDAEFFKPIPSPKPGDWLAEHKEPGQSFEEFVNANLKRPDNIRNIIYLQPLEYFLPGHSPPLELLQEYMQAFFMMEIRVLPGLMQDKRTFTTRKNPYTGHKQVLTTDILRILKTNLPADAFCLLAITMQDLYPHPSWNFVFGQAAPEDRVGVFSFARYDPLFYGMKRDETYEQVLLKRSCRVLGHETSHLFGFYHCIFYACMMNGSNHLAESDARPMHLCPVCLRKLQYSIGFDPVERYRHLQKFYQKVGLDEEAQWVQNRLQKITTRSD